MSESASHVEEILRTLFKEQKLAVLSTQNSGQPYASLVAFVASDDLKHLYFATLRTTRKYHHLSIDSRIAMLIDSRSNLDSDIETAVAVTATGIATEVREQDKDRSIGLYLSRHPHLRDFIQVQSCALIEVAVGSYFLVSRFQQVSELHLQQP